jgi:hypothetical protein
LTECLRFDLGEAEWRAMGLFAELCGKWGLIGDGGTRLVGV